MKKYYGYFIYNDEQYVIRFKIKGSLKWNERYHCFEDAKWYTRSAADIICLAAFWNALPNVKGYDYGILLTHRQFVEYRITGVKRWKPAHEIIDWGDA